MRFYAHAKINWTLDITGVNGPWHVLDMIMDSVSLCDVLDITPTDDGKIVVANIADVANMRDNLVFRAADALQKHTGTNMGAVISMEKNIPSGAGMAGGSSDAAATLRALNRLWNTKVSDEEMAELALSIGSDVPYCYFAGRKRAKGRGEILSPCGGDRRYHLVLAMGEGNLPTGSVFKKCDELGIENPPDNDRIAKALEAGDFDVLYQLLPTANVMQPAAQELCADVNDTLAVLSCVGAKAVFMTGSGAACVGLFETEEDAKAADKALEGKVFWHTYAYTV